VGIAILQCFVDAFASTRGCTLYYVSFVAKISVLLE